MPDEALQAAFEIKAACDDISRKLLRWHWEEKPGAHSVDALMKHLAQRQKESPDYYERLPELNGRTGWQQLDTTLCMRILLDPEKDAVRPLDLLGNTPHPAAARRACNAVRMARNEAAHASDRTGDIRPQPEYLWPEQPQPPEYADHGPPQEASAHPEPRSHRGAAGCRPAGPAGPGLDDGADEVIRSTEVDYVIKFQIKDILTL